MGWDVDIVHRRNDHLVDANYWLRLDANLCYDPSFCTYLRLFDSFRTTHPARWRSLCYRNICHTFAAHAFITNSTMTNPAHTILPSPTIHRHPTQMPPRSSLLLLHRAMLAQPPSWFIRCLLGRSPHHRLLPLQRPHHTSSIMPNSQFLHTLLGD
jgi:hypothetical protein